jgi:hypothetical protein
VDRHLREWFPKLPSYTAYVQCLNIVANVFALLIEVIQQKQASKSHENAWLMDSFPIALAEQGYRFKACVAKLKRLIATSMLEE